MHIRAPPTAYPPALSYRQVTRSSMKSHMANQPNPLSLPGVDLTGVGDCCPTSRPPPSPLPGATRAWSSAPVALGFSHPPLLQQSLSRLLLLPHLIHASSRTRYALSNLPFHSSHLAAIYRLLCVQVVHLGKLAAGATNRLIPRVSFPDVYIPCVASPSLGWSVLPIAKLWTLRLFKLDLQWRT